MAVIDPTPAGSSGQPQTDPVSELRRAAAAIDAAWASGQAAESQARGGGASTNVGEPALSLQVHHLRKMAALCSMAARLLLERASSAGRTAAARQSASDSQAQAIRQFLEAQLAGAGGAEAHRRLGGVPPSRGPPRRPRRRQGAVFPRLPDRRDGTTVVAAGGIEGTGSEAVRRFGACPPPSGRGQAPNRRTASEPVPFHPRSRWQLRSYTRADGMA